MAESVQQSLDVIAVGRQNVLDAIVAQETVTTAATSRLANLQAALVAHDAAVPGFYAQGGSEEMFTVAHGIQTADDAAIAAA